MVNVKSIFNRVSLIPDVLRAFGWRGILRRIKHMVFMRLGWYERRYPVNASVQIEKNFKFPHQFELQEIREAYRKLPDFEPLTLELQSRVEQLLGGKMLYFSGTQTQIGWTPRWLENPSTQKHYDATVHWTKIRDLDPEMGDIKYTWEPSRFGFVYLLARAFMLKPNDQYPEAFWRALESWISQNPVNGGPNWRCGQETSLRTMGVVFGLLTFSGHWATTQARLDAVGAFLKASGVRIFSTLDYALSQRNNHAVSEVVGLWTLAVLFPDWQQSSLWKKTADSKLAEVLQDQFYSDGGYAQHSFNYQRLALHNLMWLARVAKITDTPLPPKVTEAMERGARFLFAAQDQITGRLPNYGANDGALILPLSEMPYRDYRPTLQAIWYLLHAQPLYQDKKVNEESIWFAPRKLASDQSPDMPVLGLKAFESGYFTARGANSFAFWRAATYKRHRPSQADNLHVDIWMRGVNLALDPGTYAYNKPFPWNNGLGKTRVHNTANIDGKDQMIRVGHFLWSSWSHARVLDCHRAVNADLWLLAATPMPKEFGNSEHRRAILRLDDTYIVADLIKTPTVQNLGIHWNLALLDWNQEVSSRGLELKNKDFTVIISSSDDAKFDLITGKDEADIRGWESSFYGQKRPCLSVGVSLEREEAKFISCFAFSDAKKVTRELQNEMLMYLDEIDQRRSDAAKRILEMVNNS
jgi:hypothetical protein